MFLWLTNVKDDVESRVRQGIEHVDTQVALGVPAGFIQSPLPWTGDTRKVWGAKRGMTRSEGGIPKLFKRASFCFFPNNNKFQFTTNAAGGRDKKVE